MPPGYYGYIWAEVLDKDAFQYFKDSGDIFNRTLARKFRKEILSRGGAQTECPCTRLSGAGAEPRAAVEGTRSVGRTRSCGFGESRVGQAAKGLSLKSGFYSFTPAGYERGCLASIILTISPPLE